MPAALQKRHGKQWGGRFDIIGGFSRTAVQGILETNEARRQLEHVLAQAPAAEQPDAAAPLVQ